MINIKIYDNNLHRSNVVNIWKDVFGYRDARNDPELTIDKKIKSDDNLFFIAQEKNRIIGTVMAGYDGHRGWIYLLAVIPEKRKQGIGTKLLKHAENELKRLGCVKINLQIISNNGSVKEFYKKNGYNIEERISMGKEIKDNIKLNE
jgi:ribosomal protein S18 acetylase RimI-like enzyme